MPCPGGVIPRPGRSGLHIYNLSSNNLTITSYQGIICKVMKSLPSPNGDHASFMLDQEDELLAAKSAVNHSLIQAITRQEMTPSTLCILSERVERTVHSRVDKKGREQFFQKVGDDGIMFINCNEALLLSEAIAHWINSPPRVDVGFSLFKKRRELILARENRLRSCGSGIISFVATDYADNL